MRERERDDGRGKEREREGTENETTHNLIIQNTYKLYLFLIVTVTVNCLFSLSPSHSFTLFSLSLIPSLFFLSFISSLLFFLPLLKRVSLPFYSLPNKIQRVKQSWNLITCNNSQVIIICSLVLLIKSHTGCMHITLH